LLDVRLFCQNRVYVSSLYIGKHLTERRAVLVCAAKTVVYLTGEFDTIASRAKDNFGANRGRVWCSRASCAASKAKLNRTKNPTEAKSPRG